MAVPSLKMNNGKRIPQIGFGLWRIKDPNECRQSVEWALETGFTHFDDAQAYENEKYLGQAVKESGIKRTDLFITTKIRTANMGMMTTIPSFEASLEKLDMDYVDLLLLHFPVTQERDPSWLKLQDLYKQDKARSIGVSNYTIKHLEEMKKFDIWPVVNQVEMSVVLQQPELVDYCKANDIVVEAYTPLVEGLFFNEPTLKEIAKKYKKTVPQIMLRWCIDYGVVVLTKSSHKERIRQNFDIFDFALDKSDRAKLRKLDRGFRVNWNPTNVP